MGAAIGASGIVRASIKAILDTTDCRSVEQLSVHDIISLHKAGVKDDKIIDLMRKTDRLEKVGVSQRVINYTLSTAS